jgi:tetratricopeptide (TPR) repeat protein
VAAFERIDPSGVELARALHIRAIIEQELKEPDASVATEARARAIAEHAVGPQHPLVAQIWNTSGGSLRQLGRYDQAIEQLGRALAIVEATKGADSTDAGAALGNLALVYLDEMQPAKAIPLLERAVAIFRARFGPEHSRVGDELDNLGGAYSKAGRDADAEATLAQALAIHRARLGPDAPATATSWKRLGYHRLLVRRWAGARDAFTEAVRAIDASQGPKSPIVVNPLVGLGDADAGLADWKAAAAAYQRALDLTAPTDAKGQAEIGAKLAAARAHL